MYRTSSKNFFLKYFGAVLFLLITAIFFWSGCEDQDSVAIAPDNVQSEVLSPNNPAVFEVMKTQLKHTPEMMVMDGVLGTATGLDEDGKLAVVVYLNTESKSLAKTVMMLPQKVDDVPLVIEYTEPFRAMRGGGGGGHTAIQTPPIELGTSGGWRYDLANGYCCGGTLGSLIQIGSTKYILSNYHVLTADIVLGGNNRIAAIGDPVIQPGLIDVGCDANSAQNVANLSVLNVLPTANIDAGIAEIIPGMVDPDGSILEIGELSSSIVTAYIGQEVKKSGRTTGLTRSTISGLNATISITYDDECAGAFAFTKVFTGQIVIANRGSRFLNSGDSGSLLVEDVDVNPRAVGLLYAGSSSTAIANPIADVLNYFGATMVGN